MAEIVLSRRRPPRIAWPPLDSWGWAAVAAVIAASAIIVVPPAIVLLLSFREGRPIDPGEPYSLAHYVAVFGDPYIYGVLANTLGVALITLVVAL
ncbi:MAG TPA: hypothetical protein VKV32_17505, partial [Stellaceae bacterium]|nr:hypothetical protein [Stellaceae bacterium]